MNPDKFKSIAINIKTYRLREELSQKKFELPISLSKTVEFFIQKGHENYKYDKSGNIIEKIEYIGIKSMEQKTTYLYEYY